MWINTRFTYLVQPPVNTALRWQLNEHSGADILSNLPLGCCSFPLPLADLFIVSTPNMPAPSEEHRCCSFTSLLLMLKNISNRNWFYLSALYYTLWFRRTQVTKMWILFHLWHPSPYLPLQQSLLRHGLTGYTLWKKYSSNNSPFLWCVPFPLFNCKMHSPPPPPVPHQGCKSLSLNCSHDFVWETHG